ncbi:uncharacterized protein K460DRAFT_394818 [Cucurbitaria berberidis CBS 394.84]|uniref:NB-ARC domain-containing protein n=1 Tax=Cucurbitaria berberidis CBS 394.84 TaxID=1168544 RepID=A0A9P4GH11_9PLEO|nr:uncharacterized protein K460DRAFT_394818 [Cucurbitaria berberidis CBS 394.84]KAF1845081.1 hypothetical protein K460DRAFT_394818 [Cucurbitaria berberidis CBS 394.84]
MEKSTIASVAESCNYEFTALLDSDPLRQQADRAELAEAVEEERARFRLWAAHIGTFAKHHSSLDYRLRESEKVRSLVISQLEILRTAELRLAELLLPGTSESETGSSEEPDVPTEDECLISIRGAIDRLHRLAKAIRHPGIASQASKANHFNPTDEFGNNEIESFEKYSLQIVQQRCPGAAEYLHHRLSKANASRRRLFLYRRKHQDILNGRRHSSPKRRPSMSQRQTQETFSALPETKSKASQLVPESSTPQKHSDSQAQSSIAKATSFVESQFKPDASSKAASSIGGTSVASIVDHSRLPPPPRVPKTRTQFECPYCCQLVPTSILGKGAWRRHLMKDLEPFRDQSTWMTHLRSHAMRWSCRLPGHPRGRSTMVFTCGNEYAAHLREQHSQGASFNDAQIDLLKRQRGLPDPTPLKSCPLCHISIGDLSQAYNEGITYTSRGETEMPPASTLALQMQKHIASHLMMIASYSLPWLDDTDDDVASDKPISFATETTSSEKVEVRGTPRADSHGDLAAQFEELTFNDHDEEPPERNQGEWDFIIGAPYEGQEFDDVLSSFVRKYHVEMAFAGSTNREPTLPCNYMPLGRNTDFFSREDALQFIETQLCSGHAADEGISQQTTVLKTCSLYGPAGIGKTQVAVEFVHRHMQDFDAVFWVHADEASKMIEDVNRITVQLGLVDETSADSGDQALTRDLFKRWLGNPAKSFKPGSGFDRANWLLVLDHVIEPAVLNQFWPAERECGSILITSRRSMPWPPEQYPSKTLERFTPQEGAEFMCNLLGTSVSPEEQQCASLISSKVKGVPYALRHLTKWIMGEDLSFSEFLAQNHTRENKKLQKKMKGELARFVVAEEHSFLEAAFESLKHSRPLLDVLSMLDPDNIPEQILLTDSPHVFIRGYPTTQLGLRKALQELLKYSLVTRSRTSTTIFIHRIVQDAVRKQMRPLHARDVFNTCVLLLSAKWYCHERGRTLESDVFSGIAQRLCEELKNFYPLTADHLQSHNPKERDIESLLAEIHHNRGVMANEINRPHESLNYLLKFNAMMMKELGDRRPGTDMRLALSFNELGCAYMLQNDYEHAEKCFEKSISSMEKLDNYERWQVSLPGVNLGVVYWLTERYTDALDILSRGLRDRERKFGFNDQESFITGRFLYALGNVHESLNDYDVSLEYHQRSLNHYRNTLGSAHHRTADAFVRITKHFMRQGRLAEALDLVDKAIQIYHNFDSAFEAETARAKFCKSKVLQQVERFADAEKELAESVKWYHELKGQDLTGSQPVREADFDRLVVFWSR